MSYYTGNDKNFVFRPYRPSVKYRPSVRFTLTVRRALIDHLKDFHTGLLLSLDRRLIHSRIYFDEIIKKFIIINCQEESS